MTYNTGNPIGSSDPRDLFDNAENFDVAINSSAETFTDRLGATRHTLAGYETLATGVPAVEASLAAQEAQAQAEAARDAAYINANMYTSTAAGLAATTEDEQFLVPAVDGMSVQRYRHDAGPVATAIGPAMSSAEAVAAVVGQQFTDYKLYPCFRRNGTVTLGTETTYTGAVTRGQVYRAVKSLKLWGFDRAKQYMMRLLWNDATSGGNTNLFRFQIYEWNGSAWVASYESGTVVTMATYGFANNQTVTFRKTVSGKTVEAVIDMTLVPTVVNLVLNSSTPDLIIDESCFADNPLPVFDNEPTGRAAMSNGQEFFVRGTGKNSLIEYRRDSVSASTLMSTGLDARSIMLEHLNIPCFVPYLDAAMSGLATAYSTVTRGQIYKSFRSLKLTGFDKTRAHKLRAVWNDAYDASHLFRLIIDAWDGTLWSTAYDSGALVMSDLGFENDETVTFRKTVSGKTVEAVIDLSLIPVNVNALFYLQSATPDMIISAGCFLDEIDVDLPLAERIALVNASKPYFNSRRKPTFSIVFDDGNTTDALAFSICKEYGFIANFALPTVGLDEAKMSEYLEYYAAGSSIISHSTDGTNMNDAGAITSEQVEERMADSKAILEGYGVKISGWQTPASVMHSSFLPIIEKYYGYGFTRLNAGLFDETVDPLKMARYGLEQGMEGHNVAAVKARIDLAITNGELLVIYQHKLPSTYLNADETPTVSIAEFREVMQYLRDQVDAGMCQVLATDEAVYQYYKTPVIS